LKTILDKRNEKDESFSLELFAPEGGLKLGRIWKTVVTIINDDGKNICFFYDCFVTIISILDLKTLANKMANMVNADLDAFSVVKKGYREQFSEAMNVNGGDIENATVMDYIMHFLAFPWKVC
jgi:solute carrier family 8 (sodium/calcium exchanger)